jgi:hypothetical protein
MILPCRSAPIFNFEPRAFMRSGLLFQTRADLIERHVPANLILAGGPLTPRAPTTSLPILIGSPPSPGIRWGSFKITPDGLSA